MRAKDQHGPWTPKDIHAAVAAVGATWSRQTIYKAHVPNGEGRRPDPRRQRIRVRCQSKRSNCATALRTAPAATTPPPSSGPSVAARSSAGPGDRSRRIDAPPSTETHDACLYALLGEAKGSVFAQEAPGFASQVDVFDTGFTGSQVASTAMSTVTRPSMRRTNHLRGTEESTRVAQVPVV